MDNDYDDNDYDVVSMHHFGDWTVVINSGGSAILKNRSTGEIIEEDK